MKMKELEARTGVGRETIRYYIREGLLDEPERPKRNVAVYDENHVRRITLIKRLQHERFLPLAKIKDVLARGTAELEAEEMPSLLGFEFLLSARFGAEQSRQPVPLREVAESTGITLREIEEMDQVGLVTIDKGGSLSKQDAGIVALWGQMRRAGYTEDRGYDMSAFGRYVESANDLAAKDVEVFLSNLPANTSIVDAAQMAETGIVLTNDILGRLRLRAIIRELSRLNARVVESTAAKDGQATAETSQEKKKA